MGPQTRQENALKRRMEDVKKYRSQLAKAADDKKEEIQLQLTRAETDVTNLQKKLKII